MSQIIEHWECNHCGHEFNQYVSFGHPEETFIYKWKCSECNGINELKVYGQFALWDDLEKNLIRSIGAYEDFKSDDELEKIYNSALNKAKRGY